MTNFKEKASFLKPTVSLEKNLKSPKQLNRLLSNMVQTKFYNCIKF